MKLFVSTVLVKVAGRRGERPETAAGEVRGFGSEISLLSVQYTLHEKRRGDVLLSRRTSPRRRPSVFATLPSSCGNLSMSMTWI